MKKILLFMIGLTVFTSCFKNMKNTLSTRLDSDFEISISENASFFEDSLMIAKNYSAESEPVFVVGNPPMLAFYHKSDEQKEIIGGSRLSYSRNYVKYENIDETFVPKFWSAYESHTIVEKPSKAEDKPSGEENTKPVLAPNGFMLFYDNPDQNSMPKHDVVFLRSDIGTCTPSLCYVNNTALVVKAIKKYFTKGDRITLTAKGYKNEIETGSSEIFLADFSADKDSVVTNWTKFDLSKLGEVDCIDFELKPTKTEIPPYFCYDFLSTQIYLEY